MTPDMTNSENTPPPVAEPVAPPLPVLGYCRGCGVALTSETVRYAMGTMYCREHVPAVEPPPQLITRIINEVPLADGGLISGRQAGGVFGWLRGWMKPSWQPRLAMGMAMTILSFSMLGRFTAPVKQLKPSDLDPVKVWAAVEDKSHRIWDRTLKYYESLRVVYEIQSRLKDLSDQEATEKTEKNEPKLDQKKPEGLAK